MIAKDAIGIAKRHVMETFSDEGIANLGLEEIEFDSDDNAWRVTLGFSRPWDRPSGHLGESLGVAPGRSYKVVLLSDRDGRLLSIKNRDVRIAA
jgi:hypothetical protein